MPVALQILADQRFDDFEPELARRAARQADAVVADLDVQRLWRGVQGDPHLAVAAPDEGVLQGILDELVDHKGQRCGGLGGQVFEELARAGVGEIVVVDPDRFAAHNLNRQALCTVEEIGQFKVQAARRRGRLLNPAVTVLPFAECFSEDIFDEVSQARVVIDCLDSVADRLELADFCQVQAIPLVHGAVNQWYGQVGVQKEKPLVRELYSQVPAGKGEEKVPVLSCTVAAVASVQAAETIKLLLDLASPLHDNWQSIDLLSCEMEQVG